MTASSDDKILMYLEKKCDDNLLYIFNKEKMLEQYKQNANRNNKKWSEWSKIIQYYQKVMNKKINEIKVFSDLLHKELPQMRA